MTILEWMNKYRCTKLVKHRVLSAIDYLWLALQSMWLRICPGNKYVNAINEYVRRNISKLKSTVLFLKALAKNPKAMGAVLPSSHYLAHGMVTSIKLSPGHGIVELGPGTGVITRQILQLGIAAQQIIAIETSAVMVTQLRQQFPNINVIEGDARQLAQLLKDVTLPIDTVISSLPLRAMPEEIAHAILLQIPQILSPDGRYIQYTYDIRNGKYYYPNHFQLIKSKIIWRNIPPARIDVFTFDK